MLVWLNNPNVNYNKLSVKMVCLFGYNINTCFCWFHNEMMSTIIKHDK